jgi:serine/threonine protein kinase
MLDFSLGWRFPILKLIDYSDSMVIDEKHRLEVVSGSYKVYSTPAYCPLESSTFNEKYEQQGLINPKVDNWSLGVVLFEVLNGYLPISYSTCTTKDIHALWKY